MIRLRAVLCSLVLVVLAGCSAPTTAPPLDGTSWVVTAITGEPTLNAHPPTLSFADTKVSGSTGCNSFTGAYTRNGDGVTFSPIAVTQMACADAAMTQETAFTAALTKVAQVRSEGSSLLLIDAAGKTQLTLSAPPTPSPSPLGTTTWKLTSIRQGATTSSLIAATSATLTINTTAGSYSGKACNSFGGDLTHSGDSITFDTPHTTWTTCPAAELRQEKQILTTLTAVTTWKVDGSTLSLSTANGDGLEFEAS